MSGFQIPAGFEDALRPPIDVGRARHTPAVLKAGRPAHRPIETRLRELARRSPEVMVKVTGRTRDVAHLRAHLDYISRNGSLSLETPEGERLEGRAASAELAADWAAEAQMDSGRRRNSPMSRSLILSMPAGTDARRLEDAARAFAAQAFGGRFPYVLILHDEGRHPHVHLSVRSLGAGGQRLNPRKADLQLWRELFAARLREREVPAEATPRRARGVVLKAERTSVRRMRERFTDGRGPLPAVLETAYREAVMPGAVERPWEAVIRARQLSIRRRFVALAIALKRSGTGTDRTLGAALERFVQAMPEPQTRHDILKGRLGDRRRREPERDRPQGKDRD